MTVGDQDGKMPLQFILRAKAISINGIDLR